MQRHTLQSLLDIPGSRGSDEARKPRLPKSLPSGSQLPSCWNEAMDRAICHMEAQNEVYATAMVRLLKRRFPELEGYVIPVGAVERRIETLDLQANDYFKNGMETAVANAEANGFVLPEYDPAKYPSRKFERKSDLEVYGSGSPMTGVLGYGSSNVADDEPINRGAGKMSIGDRSKTNTPSKSADHQRNARNESLRSPRRVQLGGEHVQAHNLTDITNEYNSPGLPVTQAAYSNPLLPRSTSISATKAATTPLPVTTVNAQGNQYFPTPSSKDKHTKTEGAVLPSTAYVSTPSSKDGNFSNGQPGNTHSAAQYISAPSGKLGKADAVGSSGDLYQSGKENTTSGMSSTTTGTSILGKEIPGMSAALGRRHQKVDRRATPDD